MIQQMLAIWSLLLLPVLNPAWTSGSSQFKYCWSLAWRILSITLLVCRWVQLCDSWNILWCYIFLRLEWKLTFSGPCPSLCNPMDCNPPSSSVHGIFQYWSGLLLPTPRLWSTTIKTMYKETFLEKRLVVILEHFNAFHSWHVWPF